MELDMIMLKQISQTLKGNYHVFFPICEESVCACVYSRKSKCSFKRERGRDLKEEIGNKMRTYMSPCNMKAEEKTIWKEVGTSKGRTRKMG